MKEACGQSHARYPAGRVDGEKRVEKNILKSTRQADLSPKEETSLAMGKSQSGSQGESSPSRSAGAFMGVQVAGRCLYSTGLATR